MVFDRLLDRLAVFDEVEYARWPNLIADDLVAFLLRDADVEPATLRTIERIKRCQDAVLDLLDAAD